MSAEPYTSCPHFMDQAGHVVRCRAGKWGGFPSQGVCGACFAGTVTEQRRDLAMADVTAFRTMDEIAVNETICRACEHYRTDQKCIKLIFSDAPCGRCSAPWIVRSRTADCPAAKWPAPPPLDYPGISCYMPTRALPPGMHGEAVACFLAQDYPGPKELVVYNNDPSLELVFDHPEVTIVNELREARAVGNGFAGTIAECRYDLLACWEDDDIRLASHLSSMFRNLGEAGAVRARRYWYLDQSAIKEWAARGPVHSSWLLRRAVLEKAGGYPTAFDAAALWAALAAAATGVTWDCQPAETTLLYRGRPAGEPEAGRVEIVPQLLADYAAIVDQYIKETGL